MALANKKKKCEDFIFERETKKNSSKKKFKIVNEPISIKSLYLLI